MRISKLWFTLSADSVCVTWFTILLDLVCNITEHNKKHLHQPRLAFRFLDASVFLLLAKRSNSYGFFFKKCERHFDKSKFANAHSQTPCCLRKAAGETPFAFLNALLK